MSYLSILSATIMRGSARALTGSSNYSMKETRVTSFALSVWSNVPLALGSLRDLNADSISSPALGPDE